MIIAVYGAAGHTARFVIAELVRRGHTPIAIGRDATALAGALAAYGGAVEARVASLDAPEALDRSLDGVDAVVHCAGPFLDTATPLIEAALRRRVHYFDLTAEQGSALHTFERFNDGARERGVLVMPAVGFYGGLGDLMATAAMHDWTRADRIEIAIALDSWHPTAGTRRTGRRNTAPRLAFVGGVLAPMQPSTSAPWAFAEPFGTQEMVEMPLTETVLIARHLAVRDVRNFINQTPLRDLRDAATPAPVATDARGRSDQRFLVEAVASHQGEQRRVAIGGRDIYAVTAPLVVEIAERVRAGSHAGVFAVGQIVDAAKVLGALADAGEITLSTR